MKALFIFFLAAISAHADPCRYEWRSWGGVNVSLLPLFQWWNFVAQATNPPIDMTVMSSNTLAAVSNLWLHLPAQPRPGWCRVTGSQITIVGPYWKVAATIWPAPMMERHAVIYLANPPVKEIQNFNFAKNTCAALMSHQQRDASAAAGLNDDVQANLAYSRQMNFYQAAFPYNDRIVTQADNANREYNRSTNGLANTQSRIRSRDEMLKSLDQFLGTFPSKSAYQIDHFAKRTGTMVDGFEVFDLGSSEGLTY
jgi:hypothetical protein